MLVVPLLVPWTNDHLPTRTSKIAKENYAHQLMPIMFISLCYMLVVPLLVPWTNDHLLTGTSKIAKENYAHQLMPIMFISLCYLIATFPRTITY
jgi:uncharacterized membrane protein YhdT